MKASHQILNYFGILDKEISRAYGYAKIARGRGFDPVDDVEIVLAENMAERVEGLIGTAAPQIKGSGVVGRLQELEKEFGMQDWRVAFIVAEEIAMEKFCKFKDKLEAMEVGLRVGLAYITVGVVASPLEGFVRLELRKRRNGNGEYFALFFSGPIRSAGTTATCVFVALCDYVRRKMGYAEYDPEEIEVKRYLMEVRDFHERVTNLQYFPSEQEIEFMIKHLPVQICGDASESVEVSNYKDLDRFSSNYLSNGICLVIAEGLTQKGGKFWKRFSGWCKDFEMKDWKWLGDFVDLQKKIRSKGEKSSSGEVLPDYNYLKDLVAGRPILGFPMRKGGLRLRYGRSRVNGLSSTSLHPATMVALDCFIANGTQLKMERPGKSSTLSVCDSIEGPIVKLIDGSVMFLDTEDKARNLSKDVEEILFLGDILINYGDFFNRGHKLVKPGYCEEWWLLEFENAIKGKGIVELSSEFGIEKDVLKNLFRGDLNIRGEDAVNLSMKLGIPLHPRYTYHWNDINAEEFSMFARWLFEKMAVKNNNNGIEKIILPFEKEMLVDDPKNILEMIGLPHAVVSNEHIVIEKDDAYGLAASLGFLDDENKLKEISIDGNKTVLEIINEIGVVKQRDKSGFFIGARMGRPEKGKMRKLIGNPHCLFPVGEQGGKMRSLQAALEKGYIKSEFSIYFCVRCDKDSIYPVCDRCWNKAVKKWYCEGCKQDYLQDKCERHGVLKEYKSMRLDVQEHFRNLLNKLGLRNYPDLIKGVKGTSNSGHAPEHLAKGILRATEDVYVNRDGTTRYDMTEMCITHFKPREIGITLEKLKHLGYETDVNGNEIIDDNQVIEIMPQDIILPGCVDCAEDGADEVLFRVSRFADSLLEKFYGLEKFYCLKDKNDLIGHLVLAMSPHTSAGVVCRIIGFSKLQGLLAHPLLHSIMRRDADGDEACVVLLMDALLNFSRRLLPGHRGARQDAPLVLTTKLIPAEVDDMVFDMDVSWRYPLEFYEAAEKFKDPWEINIPQLNKRLGTEKQYEDYGYTHSVSDINAGVLCSSYKKLPTMQEKVLGQMKLAEKIRAVDENDVARLVIERHFMRDIRGNLRKFSQQQFRCVDCNMKFRRVPLAGVCSKCYGRIIFTIAEGSIVKYMEPAMSLVEKYALPVYLRQTLELTRDMIESIFLQDKEKQMGLGKWFHEIKT
ncbi:DNA polymerase II large subunit [Candidatus Woesearchaeota archaeon]|nr:DNA polymerase II large subunit [Candidatus Woesearchaeota archaeon]